jgi:signal transduction histidine kinase
MMTDEMKPERVPASVPASWSVFAALALIALLLLAMLGTDVVVARGVAARTSEIVENAQRSIELVDDLRAQAHRLGAPGLAAEDAAEIAERIAVDSAAYDRLATSPGEREEWNNLRALLGRLRAGAEPAELGADIEASIDKLVRINGKSTDESALAIQHIHDDAILADTVVGALAFALAVVIGVVLWRLLERQRLLVAQHLALVEERNRDLDAFAGRAAHDLRVPLSPIRGYADLVALDASASPEVREMASRIQVAVGRMARVIDDMLELARVGRAAPGQVVPAVAVARVLEDLRAELADADVQTELTSDAVACAPGVVEQIVRNLLENAAKFRSRQRALRIKIRTERHGEEVALSVEDNGVGMDPASARHVFEPGYRAEAAREIPGHGLGLAIVSRAVSAVGGSCEIFGSPEAGTSVVVRLPRVRVD